MLFVCGYLWHSNHDSYRHLLTFKTRRYTFVFIFHALTAPNNNEPSMKKNSTHCRTKEKNSPNVKFSIIDFFLSHFSLEIKKNIYAHNIFTSNYRNYDWATRLFECIMWLVYASNLFTFNDQLVTLVCRMTISQF
jgi:hypothetical protein